MQTVRKILPGGTALTGVYTDKFKNGLLSVNFISPLAKETASAGSMLAPLLRRGSVEYPNMTVLASALGNAYGAAVEPVSRKLGGALGFGFVADFLDERLSPSGGLVAPMLETISNFTGAPILENGAFPAAYVEEEKRSLSDRIRERINDKRSYAMRRLTELMFCGSPRGIDPLGTLETVAALTPESMTDFWRAAVKNSALEIFYCGSGEPAAIEDLVYAAFPCSSSSDFSPLNLAKRREKAQIVTETMDVAQSVLTLGFTGGCLAGDENEAECMVFNAIWGGGLTSKLFMNVREKLSLCYYVSSGFDPFSGAYIASAGIAAENKEKTLDEIMLQLDACKRGEISADELKTAKLMLTSRLRAAADSPFTLESYHINGAVSGETSSLEEEMAEINAVTLEQVVETANAVKQDTVYFLTEKEGAENV